jgi:oxygen-independent coproporphyrinogen-3 oxidase
MKQIGLYLHLPFCIQKCRYCDFSSWAGSEDLKTPYINALLSELEFYKAEQNNFTVNTIFMGGGTPTLFDGEILVQLLEKCREIFHVAENAEISIECNPGTADAPKLEILRKGGFNRLSIGLQAWQDHHLAKLGRIHNSFQFKETVEWAKQAGFSNISADVIFGLPGQTWEEWRQTLEKAVETGINHLSAYSLKIEEGTVFYKWQQQGKLKEMDDGEERDLYHKGVSLLQQMGFNQYEISNFALPGWECRHNLNYWRNGEYIGCGCSAHSCYKSARWGNVPGIVQYIERMQSGLSVVDSHEGIDKETEIFETLMLGLRLNEGINKKAFQQRFGFSINERYEEAIKELKSQGLLMEGEHTLYCTPLGFDFQNRIALAFMD